MLLSKRPLRNTHDAAVSRAATVRPRAVIADEWLAKLVVAAEATFGQKKPMRARSRTGMDSQCPTVNATVCNPR